MPKHDDLSGILKCYVHNVSFDTPEEFYQHEGAFDHTQTGDTICKDCWERERKIERVQIDPDIANGKHKGRCEKCQEEMEDEIISKLEKQGKIKKVKQH